jgi:hypothetical protein
MSYLLIDLKRKVLEKLIHGTNKPFTVAEQRCVGAGTCSVTSVEYEDVIK